MNVNELKESKFLKRSDVGEGTVVTISGVDRANVAKEGAPEEMKWILHVEEFDKGLVLNSTCGQLIAQALKSEESDDWVGKQVVLYDDPSVSFGGKLVGGIRVRPVPKSQQTAPTQRPPAGTYRPTAEAGVQPAASPKMALKLKFKNHPSFGKDFQANDVNEHLLKNYGAKLDDLNDEQIKDVNADFDHIIETVSIPF